MILKKPPPQCFILPTSIPFPVSVLREEGAKRCKITVKFPWPLYMRQTQNNSTICTSRLFWLGPGCCMASAAAELETKRLTKSDARKIVFWFAAWLTKVSGSESICPGCQKKLLSKHSPRSSACVGVIWWSSGGKNWGMEKLHWGRNILVSLDFEILLIDANRKRTESYHINKNFNSDQMIVLPQLIFPSNS